MKVIVIGTGYVGLIQGVCLADVGHQVICIDIDAQKIKKLKKAIAPIYDPGIEELIKKNVVNGRLQFDISFKKHLKGSDMVFIAVGTPSNEDGDAELNRTYALNANLVPILA
ncbi:MAG: 2-dehydropantoate 2-reductase N-terminal domain-containing protein [bacterium]